MKFNLAILKSFKDDFICKKYNVYKNEIYKKNLKNLRVILIMGIIITTILLFTQFLSNCIIPNYAINFILLTYLCLTFVLTIPLQKHIKYVNAFVYIGLLPIFALLIYFGTVVAPDKQAITVIVTLIMLPFFIIDRPWRTASYILAVSVAITISEFYGKDFDIFVYDARNIGFVFLVVVLADTVLTSERMENFQNIQRLKYKSESDSLTKLLNRGAGTKKIEKLIKTNKYGMFCIIDIDDFKMINDNYGHTCGDEALMRVADTIQSCFSSSDVLMRIGGDELAIYAIGITDEFTAEVTLNNLYRRIEKQKLTFMPKGMITISVGVSFNKRNNTKNFQQLYLEGDQALYQAKEQGKNRYVIPKTKVPS